MDKITCPPFGGISGSCQIAEEKSPTWRNRWDFAVGGRMGIRWADVSRRIEEDVIGRWIQGGERRRCLRRRFGRLIAESMVGSDRDRQRSRDLMRGTSRASRLSPAKRQPIGFSSPTVSNDNVHSNSGDGVDTNASMARWKDKVRTSRWRLNNNDSSGEVGCSRSEGEEANPIGAMLGSITTATLTSRKTVGLHEKVAEDSDIVDPASVPRKLRSAINKRSSQISPNEATVTKKKHHCTSNGLQMLYGDGRRCKQSMLFDSLTKDEEIAIDALCTLSRMPPPCKQIPPQEWSRVSEDCHDIDATSGQCLEDIKEEDKNVLQQTTVCEVRSLSYMEKPLKETMKDGHTPSRQPMAVCGKPTYDFNCNTTPEPGGHIDPLSENEHPGNTPFRNLRSSLSPSGILPHSCNGKRALQPTQYDDITALPPCKSDMPLQNGDAASASLGHEVQRAEHGSQSCAKLVYEEGAIPPHTEASSNCAECPDLSTITARLASNGIDHPTKKVLINVKSATKNCATHVVICNLIKSYQKKGKQRTVLLSSEEPKSRIESNLHATLNNDISGLRSGSNSVTSAATNGSIVERNTHGGRNEILCSKTFMPAHLSSVSLEVKQKQTCDFLSLSSGGVASTSPNEHPGKLVSPFLHAQVPHHSLMSYPFPRVPYAPPYPEKLAPAATQQAQLQGPHYGGNPFHGLIMDNTIGNIQLQQQCQQRQIWEAHLANYRDLIAFLGLQCSDDDTAATEVIEGSDIGIVGDDTHVFGDASLGPAPGVDTAVVTSRRRV
ncbi:hypothetical protein OPV22_015971 [Ensete ventricosum]|uniref:Uncharacterized protein n=1 Tax=Ensete ventricosum TaxID=4639 RepID=A0AAV8R512_ENSVE|nr:hypothetical protein OPV22_015971 [Ensete ventricosum]